MPTYAVGIDSGTQGTKALVVDAGTGRVLGRGTGPPRHDRRARPRSERAGPGGLGRAAARRPLAAALKESRIDAEKVVSIGVSGQQHGFVPLDAAGKVIRPAKLWNDTSTIRENEDIVAALGGVKAAIARLGIAPAVGFTASKILWLKRHEPKKFARLAHGPPAPQLPELLAHRAGPTWNTATPPAPG
ncbi:MAG: FGGY family carbohydrate kinase [Candidatus Moduliflexus flocculans]|nr:FGGY family carbohydrate kinase [Candidatus Moduliflexus flocculans]